MGNVLRVLGIVAASMLLGLVGLFLALFSICGGLTSTEGGEVLAICLVLLAAAVTVIVILGRGLASARSAAGGLAVAPAGAVPAAAPAAATVVQARPLSATDRQVLVAIRVALAVYLVLSIGSMAVNAVNFRTYGSSIAIQLILRSVLGLLPPALVLAAVSLRTPPAGMALEAAAGFGIASILFRFGFVGFSGLLTSTVTQSPDMTILLLRMATFSAIEAAVAGLALHLRSRLGPANAGAIVVAVVVFLLWDGLVQVSMRMLTALMF